MIVTKKAIPRRTVLRGIGATLALPLLDGMVPAFAAVRNTAAKLQDDPRVAWFSATAVNHESIHNHNAFAATEWKRP